MSYDELKILGIFKHLNGTSHLTLKNHKTHSEIQKYSVNLLISSFI